LSCLGRVMDRYKLQEKVEGLGSLPTLPEVAARVLNIATAREKNFARLISLIRCDPALAAGLLRRANLPQHAGSQEILSIERAAKVLGNEELLNFVLSARSSDARPAGKARRAQLDIWLHSLAVACCARWLAEKTGKTNPAEAELAGLLHDVGKIALEALFSKEYSRALRIARQESLWVLDAERRIFALDHTHIGKWLVSSWGLPDALLAVVWLHDQSPEGLILEERSLELVRLVHLANLISRQQNFTLTGPPPSLRSIGQRCREVGLSEKDYHWIVSNLGACVEEGARLLGLEVSEEGLYFDALQRAQVEQARILDNLYSERRQLQRHLNHLSALHDLNLETKPGMNLGGVLARIVERVGQALQVARTICYITDAPGNFFIGKVFDGQKKVLKDLSIEMPRSEEPDLDLKILQRLFEIESGEKLSSLVSAGQVAMIPLPLRKPLVGSIIFDNRPAGAGSVVLTTEEMLAFVSSAALAIDRAWMERLLGRLSEELAQGRQEMERTSVQLIEAKKQAAIGRIAAGAAHEIHTPLAVISGRAQLLLRGESNSNRRRQLNLIQAQCERISKMIKDLSLVARPQKPLIRAVDLRHLLEDVLRTCRKDVRSKRARITLKIPARLPPIAADGEQITQVVSHLLRNSLQAIKKAGRIAVSARLLAPSKVEVAVKDDGCGVPAEELEKIFDPFYSAKEAGRGMGLGLSISRSIVSAHGGTIEILPARPRGLTVRIELPAWQAERSQAPVLLFCRQKSFAKLVESELARRNLACDFFFKPSEFSSALEGHYAKVVLVKAGRLTGKSVGEISSWRGRSPQARMILIAPASQRRWLKVLEGEGVQIFLWRRRRLQELVTEIVRLCGEQGRVTQQGKR